MERGNFEGKDMPADLSPLAAANELVRRLRGGGIIARAERVNSSSQRGNAAFRHITLTTCLFVIFSIVFANFGSRPNDHYFRNVCWFVCLSVSLFVCLFVQSFPQLSPSLIRFRTN